METLTKFEAADLLQLTLENALRGYIGVEDIAATGQSLASVALEHLQVDWQQAGQLHSGRPLANSGRVALGSDSIGVELTLHTPAGRNVQFFGPGSAISQPAVSLARS